MSLRRALRELQATDPSVYYLVSWTEEDAVSTVPSKSILGHCESPLSPGSLCQVRMKGKVYGAKVVASGTRADMEDLERKECGELDEAAHENLPPPKKSKTSATSKKMTSAANSKKNSKKNEKSKQGSEKKKGEGITILNVAAATSASSATPSLLSQPISKTPPPQPISKTPLPHHISKTPQPQPISKTPSPYCISKTSPPQPISKTPSPNRISITPPPQPVTSEAQSVYPEPQPLSSKMPSPQHISSHTQTTVLETLTAESLSQPSFFDDEWESCDATPPLLPPPLPNFAALSTPSRIQGCISNIAYILELEHSTDVTGSTHPSTAGLSTTHPSSTGSLTPTVHQSLSTVQTDVTPSVTHQSTDQSIPLTSQQSTPPNSQSPIPPTISHPPPASDSQDKEKLPPPSEVIEKYPQLRGDCKMGELATKLARESFFGKKLMQRSTVMGHKEYLALPADHLNAQTILSVCPDYHCNPRGFESIWRKCIDSLHHACSNLRK